MNTGKEERTKHKKYKKLHKTTGYHPLTSVHSQGARGPSQLPLSSSPVHVPSRAFRGMEYPFDQLGSAVLAMLPHFLWTFSLAEYGTLKSF